MKLQLLRFLEALFSIPSAFFGDRADAIDIELNEKLRKAKDHIMKCTKKRSYLETPQTELSDEKEKLWIEIEQKYAR